MQVSHPQTLFLIQHSHNRPRSLMAMIDHGAIYYTPHLWRVGCNSFDIVCVSLCVSVSLSQPNRRTYRLEFWHGGQVEWYLSRVDRSRSKLNVTGSKNVHWNVQLTSESLVYGHAKEDAQEYNWQEDDVGCFQSVCSFSVTVLVPYPCLILCLWSFLLHTMIALPGFVCSF